MKYIDITKLSRKFFATKVDGRSSVKMGGKYLNYPKLANWATVGFMFFAGQGILGDYQPHLVEYLKYARVIWVPCFTVFVLYWTAVFCNDFIITRPGDVNDKFTEM